MNTNAIRHHPVLALLLVAAAGRSAHAQTSSSFSWPDGARAAVSLSFDDARLSQVDVGLPILDRNGVVTPDTFAYPCGQSFVGRGKRTRSYVPLVAKLFLAGRGWLGEAPNDPLRVDLSQVLGREMDGKGFDEVRGLLEEARAAGAWLVLAGHDIGPSGPQTTRVAMLETLLPHLRDPANGYWVAPVGAVARYIAARRSAGR
jgi:peptidoglycan-N-acetylglucosamine deacetylase